VSFDRFIFFRSLQVFDCRFLYALFVAIDANFRLARRNVSSDTVDPGLNHGYAFFVEETAFKSFLNSHGRITQEVSSNYY
jgi:hypothetical protein